MRKSPRALEHKAFIFKLDAPPDDEGRFSGSAAVFGNVDKGNDLIEPGATTKTIQENPEVPIFWVHEYGFVPIGMGTLSTDGKKSTRIEGHLFLETSELAREVFGAMKEGAVKGLSIGYNTLKRTFKGSVRHLQEIAIGEVSLCPFPMNPLAEVDAVKDLYGWEQTEGVSCLLSMIRSGADFLVEEVAEGDTTDAARMQSILGSLAKLLASELAEVASGDGTEGEDSPDLAYDEAMGARIDLAVKNLEALRTLDGAKEAADTDVEPVADHFRHLIAAFGRNAEAA